MIDEIRAEYLLTKLYPELDERWVARYKGTFYRNYSRDAMHIYEEERLVELSRDGFLKLLPDGFLADEEENTEHAAHESISEVRQRLHRLYEAFMPVDTQRFKTYLHLEEAIDPILELKLKYILKKYFDYDLAEERNEYIAQVAPLLPYVNRLRGDILFVLNAIEVVTGCSVRHEVKDYSCDDNTKFSMPMVLITVSEDDLTPETYKSRKSKMEEFLRFLTERFLPFDTLFRIRVTGKQNDIILLEYNSWTTTQEYAGKRV